MEKPMKVLSKQKNSRMCVICGMDNPFGVKAQIYNMEDGSVMTPFRFRQEHQSYPQRVHGGLIAAMLDGLGLAIAHAIAASHKGSLGVRCRGGKVIFTAKLPLKKQGAAQEGFPSCMAVCTNTIFCFFPVDKAGIFV